MLGNATLLLLGDYSALFYIFIVLPLSLGLIALITAIVYLAKASNGSAGTGLQVTSYIFSGLSTIIGIWFLLNLLSFFDITLALAVIFFFVPLTLTIIATTKQKK